LSISLLEKQGAEKETGWLVKSTITYNIASVILAIPAFLTAVAGVIALFHH
jgi:UPF0716 family protein affecting phage T7 exclusion